MKQSFKAALRWVLGVLGSAILVSMACLGISLRVHGQTIVNTETLLLPTDTGFIWTAGLGGNVSAGNSDVFDLKSDFGATKDWGATALKFVASWNRLARNGTSIQSNAFAHLRVEQGRTDGIHVFGFVQTSNNDVLLMRSRQLAGIGLKRRIVQTDRANLALSWGGFWENEAYSAELPDMRLWRNSFILAGAWNPNEAWSIRMTTYAQTDIYHWKDTRVYVECSTDLSVTHRMALEWNVGLRWDGDPHAGLDPLDVGSTVGLRFGFSGN